MSAGNPTLEILHPTTFMIDPKFSLMNCSHYTPGYLSLSRNNLSWHKNNLHSFPHISLLSTPALLKNWGIVFLPAAPRPAFSSNHTPQPVGRKLTTLRERSVRIREVDGSIPFRSTIPRQGIPGGIFLSSRHKNFEGCPMAFAGAAARQRRKMPFVYFFRLAVIFVFT